MKPRTKSRMLLASPVAIALALVAGQANAHGTVSANGHTAEHENCGTAQHLAKTALENYCKRLPKTFPAVQWWAPVSWKVSPCSRRPSGRRDIAGRPHYYYRANWQVECGPHGENDHLPGYHNPQRIDGHRH